MDIHAYIERINYHGPVTPSAQTLHGLQMAHLMTVPFENLSIHAHEPIVLDQMALFDKIVGRRRGGFCYELNGLFAALLNELGFEVTMLAVEVARADGSYTPPFDHMALMVTLEQRWLVDVGFGDTFREPLLLDNRDVVAENGRFYQIATNNTHHILMEQKDGKPWRPQYRFTLQSYDFSDYAEMCHYNQTSPDSHFTQGRVCSLATENGRVTLAEMQFITTTLRGGRQEHQVADETEYARLLHQYFGIKM
ncbi:MAG: arylamine N-acetyltransferase [Chloroflexi bacterium]|nr:MAG: arylamine N-acetyltransferase [Chloroflexota bacterium]